MTVEEFFDLRIATVGPHEDPPPEAHWVRIEDPPRALAVALSRDGWFYKPCWVTYVLAVPSMLDAYVEGTFRKRARTVRKLLREVPRRYRLVVAEDGRHLDGFRRLYLRTVVARSRGKDRLAEHEEGFGREWRGYYLFDGDALVAGILVHASRRHLSVAYGAFDPVHRRRLDVEHYLIMQVLARAIEERHPAMSLGMDTNRYGHHLSLGVAAYKLRIGFTPMAYEPGGRELVRVQRFDVFKDGLFFYGYEGRGLVGHFFAPGDADARMLRHPTAPPIRMHSIT